MTRRIYIGEGNPACIPEVPIETILPNLSVFKISNNRTLWSQQLIPLRHVSHFLIARGSQLNGLVALKEIWPRPNAWAL